MPTPLPTLPPLPRPEASSNASRVDADAPRASGWRKAIVLAVSTGIGVLGGILMGTSISDGINLWQWTPLGALVLLVGVPSGLLLIVALHEAGHTVAGYLAGFELQHMSVGPLKLQRTPRGWNFSRSPHGFFQGMSHSVPGPALQKAPTRVVRRRRAVRLTGGAAANVFTGLLALGLALALPLGSETAEAGVRLFSIASLGVGVVNLIPFRTGSGLITDGARLVPLLRGTTEADRDVALATVRAEAYGGTRPSEWSPRWVQRMLTPRDYGMTDGSTRMLAYRHALDAGRPEDARVHLAEALDVLDRLPRAQHAGLQVEAAYFEAAHRNDVERARAWLQHTGTANGLPKGVPVCAAGRAEAATLLAEGREGEAQDHISTAESALNEHPVAGTAIAERAWLRDLAGRMPTCE